MPAAPPNAEMPTTQWSLIARLKGGNAKEARQALDELCRAYHYPLYCHIRRRGLALHDAEDALHEFFLKLLRLDTFGIAEAEKGRLRTFLLVALQRFLANWHRDQQRQQAQEISQDALAVIAEAKDRYAQEQTTHDESPDRLYDRQWAQELLNLALARVRAKYEAKGRAALFDTLRPVLLSGGSLAGHDGEGLAAQLGMKHGTLRTALMRLLEDYREALRQEVLQTVEDRALAKAEYEDLMAAFSPK